MPVKKFRSIEETKPPWREPGSPQLDRTIRRVLELGSAMADRRFPRGVRRFHSVEEADEFQREWARRTERESWGEQPPN